MNFFTKNYSDMRIAADKFRSHQRIDFVDDYQGESEEFIGLHARFWAKYEEGDTPENPHDLCDETLEIPIKEIHADGFLVETVVKAVNDKIGDIESDYYEEYQPCFYPLLDPKHTSQAVIDAVETYEGKRDEDICRQIRIFSYRRFIREVLEISSRWATPEERANPEFSGWLEEFFGPKTRGEE